jgi:hypothetical protein
LSVDLTSNNDYRIINLTSLTDSHPTEEEESEKLLPICSHCDKAMTLAYQDIMSSPSNQILVKKDQFYCELCGLIKDPDAKLLHKKKELQGPKITKKKGAPAFVFENIRFNILDRDKPKEFDIEPEEEERLKVEGYPINGTRVKSAETGRTIVRRYS